MVLEFMVALCVLFVGTYFLKNFQGETPRAVTLRKWLVYFTVVALLTLTVGRPWSLLWALAPVFGFIGHVLWCWKHGVHPITAEPRDRYYAARGWNRAEPETPNP